MIGGDADKSDCLIVFVDHLICAATLSEVTTEENRNDDQDFGRRGGPERFARNGFRL